MDFEYKKEAIKYGSITIEYRSVVLYLYRSFTTAHSATTTRNNFFIRVKSSAIGEHIFGYGECGLPPKKPGCYLSDIEDCYQYMRNLKALLDSTPLQQAPSSKNYKNLTAIFPTGICSSIINNQPNQRTQQLSFLLQCARSLHEQHFHAPQNALEFSIMDLWAKAEQKTLQNLLFGSQNTTLPPNYSTYTVSYEPDSNKMIENVSSAIKITPLIKFKYNANIDQLVEMLEKAELNFAMKKIIVDANCSWTPLDFKRFQYLISANESVTSKILYIEQPFDLEVADFDQWKEIKETSKFKILADESFRDEGDIEKIKQVAHGVNVKAEKTGGLFNSIRAVQAAKSSGLQVMLGSMVSSQLGCTQTFQLFSLVQYFDIDGSLLVKYPQIIGGFSWEEGGEVRQWKQGFGLRIDAGKLFE